jgi:3'-5' exoribonuclease
MTASSSEIPFEPAPDEKSGPPIVTVADVAAHDGRLVFVKAAVAAAEIGTASNGSAFAKLELVDRTGTIGAKKWDTPELPFEAGDVIGVKARVDSWKGTAQLVIESMRVLEEDPSDFVRASHFSQDELDEYLDATLQLIGGECGEVVRSIFEDTSIRAKFLQAPAAQRNHHAYERGLAEHVVSMAKLADKVVEHYATMYQHLDVSIDRDLVVAGVLLHDLGKALEFERDGVAWTTNLDAELIRHIPQCATMIHDACMATLASDDTRRRLLHVVLAHHGRLEYGSPVVPKLIEAQLVHLIDMMDSRFAMFVEALSGMEPGDVSEWVRPLGGRVVR